MFNTVSLKLFILIVIFYISAAFARTAHIFYEYMFVSNFYKNKTYILEIRVSDSHQLPIARYDILVNYLMCRVVVSFRIRSTSDYLWILFSRPRFAPLLHEYLINFVIF